MAKKFTALAEGDSWFNLPDFPIGLPVVGGADSDTIRELQARGHQIANIAHFGDTLTSIAEARDYVGGLQSRDYDVFLLCGSGNDLLQMGSLSKYLRLYRPDREVKDYFKNSFFAKIGHMELLYAEIIEDALETSKNKNLKIVSHGYDYAIPHPGGYWIGAPMSLQGIEKTKLRKDLVKEMIDQLYAMLRRVRNKYKQNFYYVDLRGTVGDQWHDELHPKKAAFKDIAKKIEKKVLRIL